MAAVEIDPSNWASRARLRCPRGHSYWRGQADAWYCRTCERAYDRLVDHKTGREVERSDVELARR